MIAPRFTAVLALAAVAGLVDAPARAQIPADVQFTYEFAQSGVPLTSSTLAYTPGSPVTLQVFLRQTGGSPTFVSSQGGLTAGGAMLRTDNPLGVARVNAPTDITINTAAFNDAVGSNSTRQANADFAYAQGYTDEITNAQLGADGRLLIATFTLQTAMTGGNTVLAAVDRPGAFEDFRTGSGLVLDPRVAAVSLTFTPVPEPGFLLLAAAAGGLGLRAARRRFAK